MAKCLSLQIWKHAYWNILKISPQKTESFQIKILILFHNSAQSIAYGYLLDPPRRGGSNEYPQSMFLSRNKKNNVYPCKPQFYYIKVEFKGVKLYMYVFLMHSSIKQEYQNKYCSVISQRKYVISTH